MHFEHAELGGLGGGDGATAAATSARRDTELQLGKVDFAEHVKIRRSTNQQLLDVLAEANRRQIVRRDRDFESKAVRLSKLYGRAVHDKVVLDGTSRSPHKMDKAKASRPHRHHLDRALEQLRAVALRYNPTKTPGLKAFVRKALTLSDLRDLLFNNFRLKLHLPELVALFDHLDPERRGMVNYVKFLVFFTKMACAEQSAEQHLILESHRETRRRAEQSERQLQARFANRTHMDVPEVFAADDLHTALEKMSHAVGLLSHDKCRWIEAFEVQGLLTPTAFAEQVRRNFNVKLDHTEVAALLAVFVGKNGFVDMVTFLRGFFGGAPSEIASASSGASSGGSLPPVHRPRAPPPDGLPAVHEATVPANPPTHESSGTDGDSTASAASPPRVGRLVGERQAGPGDGAQAKKRPRRQPEWSDEHPSPNKIKVRHLKGRPSALHRSVNVSGSALVSPGQNVLPLQETPEQQVKRWNLTFELKWPMLHEFLGTLRNYKIQVPQLRHILRESAIAGPGEGLWMAREPFTNFCDEYFAHNWFSHRSGDRLFSTLDPWRRDQLWITELLVLVLTLDSRKARTKPEKMMEEVHRNCGIDLHVFQHSGGGGRGGETGRRELSEEQALHDQGFPELKVPLGMLSKLFATLSMSLAETGQWDKLFEDAAEAFLNKDKSSGLQGAHMPVLLPDVSRGSHRPRKTTANMTQIRKRADLEFNAATWRDFIRASPKLVEFFKLQQTKCRELLSMPHKPKQKRR